MQREHSHSDTVTFRIDPQSKRDFAGLARREAKPVGELLRELVLERLAREKRAAFEAEARRQSLACAAAAQAPDSDEAEVMRWIEGAADTTGWRA